MSANEGYIQTVNGRIQPDEMGMTLTHEHIICDSAPEDYSGNGVPPMEELSEMRWTIHAFPDNLRMTDESIALHEISKFKAAGGSTIIECSCYGLKRDPEALRRLSSESGLNIVMGTGVYTRHYVPKEIEELDEDGKAELFIRELEEGEGGIRAGFIGEIGLDDMGERDRSVLRAAGKAQRVAGCAIVIHQPGLMHANFDILDILDSCGADLTKVILGHCDPFFDDPLREGYLTQALALGANIAFDTFGLSVVLGNDICFPRDIDRLSMIRRLTDLGYGGQIVLGDDIFSNIQLTEYGGYGYAHIPRHIIPLMKSKGFDDDDIDGYLVKNPERIFNIDK